MEFRILLFVLLGGYVSANSCTGGERTGPEAPQQMSDYAKSIRDERAEKDAEFMKEGSPLPDQERAHFTGLKYYPPDTAYRVAALFAAADSSPVFTMGASGKIASRCRMVGRLYFSLQGQTDSLEVYDLVDASAQGYEAYFVPFYDLTNGAETYGGGRYIDIDKSEFTHAHVIIDFNKAYNPYCAYNHDYSCAIPPPVNSLHAYIRAGEKLYYKK